MKNYTIRKVPNPLCRRISVPKECRELVTTAIKGLPFIDEARAMQFEATQIHVLISDLAEESDLEEMEEVIKGYTEPE